MGYKKVICYAYDSGIQICFSLGCLAIPSIFIGYYTKDILVGVGTPFFGNSIFINLDNFNLFDSEFLKIFYKVLPVNLSLISFFLAFYLYLFKSLFLIVLKLSFFGKKMYNFLNRKWFFDKIYNEFFNQSFFKFGYSISYKVRVNNLRLGLWKGIEKETVSFLKASMYLKFLDFNFEDSLIQRRLNLLLLFLILNVWKTDNLGLIVLFMICNITINIYLTS